MGLVPPAVRVRQQQHLEKNGVEGGGRALIALCYEGEHKAEGPACRATLIRLNVRKESAGGGAGKLE